MKHHPYQKLKQELKQRSLTYRHISNELGISISSVSRKINGISDFYIDEVLQLENALGLSVLLFLP